MLPDAYGCAVANRYGDLLDDEADPFDLISKVEMEKEKKKKSQDGEKKGKQKKSGQKESQKERRVHVGSEVQDPAPGQEEAYGGTKRAAFGERWANKEEYPQEFSISRYVGRRAGGGGGGGGGGGRGFGGGGGVGYSRNSDNYDLRGKREYDRQSGTGISPEEKRGGRGPWNWGSAEETARAMEEENGEVLVQVAMEMTLDEWKALQETSRPKAEFNIRKSENQIPSKAKVIHQSKRVEGTIEEVEDEGNFLRRSVNDITSLLDINFGSLGRPSRGGRGRGARGGPANLPERAKPILERVCSPLLDH
uniref:Hyaluronan/mRNA-binding protein domain-containing protein n=1 Tax=Cyclopterus lumpus TaxID=8103 RepID=A0A8C2ZJE7_CYCLU